MRYSMAATDFAAYVAQFQQFPRLGLERMERLCALLGDPQERLRVIHVAGTNGKGSVSAFIDAALRAAGLRAGLFSSPELERVNERIAVDGQEIGTAELVALLEEIRPAVEEATRELGDAPSRFEITTAAAFLHFVKQGCDYAVLETGMGGRLDSTNVCARPLVTVITPVALDHQAYLGDTLARIAGEKAGIIKPRVPVVCAPQPPEAMAVIEAVCEEKGCKLIRTRAEDIEFLGPDGFFERISYGDARDARLGLAGAHQAVNAAVALDALGLLPDVPPEAMQRGLNTVRHRGRMEVFRQAPLLLFDGAHNPAGAEALAQSLARYRPGARFAIAMAAMEDKDVAGMVRALEPVASRFLALKADNPRALDAKALAGRIAAAGADAAPSTLDAVLSLEEDTVVCGSLYFYAAFVKSVQARL